MKSLILAALTMVVMASSFAFAQSATPAPSPAATVQVPEPAAPPQWASDLIVKLESMPVVGPYVSKALVYIGIVSSILTAIVAFLLSVLGLLAGVLNIAGVSVFADKLSAFKDGKIMYWLKYLSMFNAKKPEDQKAA